MENRKFNFVLLGFNRTTANSAFEINSYATREFGCDGVEEFSLEEARVDEILGKRAYSGGDIPESLIEEVQAATLDQDAFTYKYFFYVGDFEENATNFVDFIKSNYPQLPLHSGQKDFEDWNSEWKKFYEPIWVSENLEVVPEWMVKTHANRSLHQVYIYPGMGFGTGTHETTYLCLKLFDQVQAGMSSLETCLDFGCGSGILGIAAIKMKNAKVHFCDIDRNALENCTQNIVLNFEGQNLSGTELVLRERYTPKKYDLVFANILESVLIQEKKTILSSLKNNGYLIVSGILNDQVDSILKSYPELEKKEVASKGAWSAILFQRKE